MDMREAFEAKFPVPDGIYWCEQLGYYTTKDPELVPDMDRINELQEAWQAALQSQPAMGSGAEPVGYVSRTFLEGKNPDRSSVICTKISREGMQVYCHPVYLHPAPTAQDSNLSGLQGKKLKFLQGRSDFRRQCWEEVAKLDFADGRSCYVDIFGRVLWLDAQDSKVPEQRDSDIPAHLDVNGCRGYRIGFEACRQAMLSTAPSLAERPDHIGEPAAMVAEKPQWVSCEERLPTPQDSDAYGHVWACGSENSNYPAIRGWDCIMGFKYWMPTGLQRPQPPEGEQ